MELCLLSFESVNEIERDERGEMEPRNRSLYLGARSARDALSSLCRGHHPPVRSPSVGNSAGDLVRSHDGRIGLGPLGASERLCAEAWPRPPNTVDLHGALQRGHSMGLYPASARAAARRPTLPLCGL